MIVRSDGSMEFDFDEDCRTDSADVSSCNVSSLEPPCFYDAKVTNDSSLENVDHSKKGCLEKHPFDWTVDDVGKWLKWAIEEFAFEPFDVGLCTLSGSEILLNGRKRFHDMLPESVSDILWEHLMILVQNETCSQTAEERKRIVSSRRSFSVSLRNLPETNQYPEIGWNPRSDGHFPNPSKICSSVSFYNDNIRNDDHTFRHSNNCSGRTFPENYHFDLTNSRYHRCNDNDTQHMNFYGDDISHSKAKYSSCMYEPSFPANELEHSYVWFNYSNQVSSQTTSTGSSYFDKPYQAEWHDSHSSDSRITVVSPHLGNGPIQLWQFLLDLLLDPNLSHVIAWTGDGWEFKLINPDKVAELWGRQKCKPKMNYEKMSRGLRYYYDKKIILKTAGKRYVYRFVCDMKQLVQCDSPQELFFKYRLSPRNDLYDFY